MKKRYLDTYYQVKVITGTGELKTLHILATNVNESIVKSRCILQYQIESFEKFLLRYHFIKEILIKEYSGLQGWQVTCCYIEACLRVVAMDCRTDNTAVLLRITANRVIGQYVRNRNQ